MTLYSFGKLEEFETVEQKKLLAVRVEDMIKTGGNRLAIDLIDEKVERLALQFYKEIRANRRYDVNHEKEDWETVNMSTLHKTDDASMAHLHLGILAYWLVSTIRYQLKQKSFNSDWREIVRTMNTQKCVTTSVVNIKDEIISVRQYYRTKSTGKENL